MYNSLTCRDLFSWILGASLVFTENLRVAPAASFTLDDLNSDAPAQLVDGSGLLLHLFRLKNGGRAARDCYAATLSTFTRLTQGAHADVGLGAPGSQGLSLEAWTRPAWGDVPLASSGAGVAEALFLSAVIAGDAGRVLLLDEPALNLHPTVQTTLAESNLVFR